MSRENITGIISKTSNITGTVNSKAQLSGNASNSKTISGNIMATVLKGLSAYEVAVKNGFVGTEEEWLQSLVGNGIDSITMNPDGTLTIIYTNGDSYTTPVSLKGKDGHSPYIGDNNNWFVYDDEADEYVDSGISSTYEIGTGLKFDEETGKLCADLTDEVIENSDKLITSGGVYSAVHNTVSSYEDLTNKPQIESTVLIGNKSFVELGIDSISADDLLEILV